jgi:hypothetical protein
MVGPGCAWLQVKLGRASYIRPAVRRKKLILIYQKRVVIEHLFTNEKKDIKDQTETAHAFAEILRLMASRAM